VLKIEVRQMFRSNGLIDDLVVSGLSEDYLQFSEVVKSVSNSRESRTISTGSSITIEVIWIEEPSELFTSLQNKDDDYFSMKDWNERNILRVIGNTSTLDELGEFLTDLPSRGEGYSYISEYSENYGYSLFSPEWQLHV